MSYILDALRKSETERRQGQVPDLGQQVQLIHRPRKRGVSPALWVALALVLNAAVLAWLFWPDQPAPAPLASAPEPAAQPVEPAPAEPEPMAPPANDAVAESGMEPPPVPPLASEQARAPEASAAPAERATIIVPSAPASGPESAQERGSQDIAVAGQAGRVPHLVELPLSFQKSVPDLTFNSHIYSSSPASRRVMINNTYLRTGDSFQGLRVEAITEEGVVLSREGRPFRVGVVRDWVSPR